MGQWPTVLAVGVDEGCLDIFSVAYHFISFSLSRYRLKYCLKGLLNPKQLTNLPFKAPKKKTRQQKFMTAEFKKKTYFIQAVLC